jgi:hypothetical protein
MAQTIIGVFNNRQNADMAISSLNDAGYSPQDISIVAKDEVLVTTSEGNKGTQMASGAATGAATGGVVGALAGLLVGLTAITIPGVGPLLVGGPIATALGLTGTAAATASGAVTGILAGGVIGALTGLGIPEEDARVYEREINHGGVLVAVPTSVLTDTEAEDIMRAHNATQISRLDLSPDMT